MREADPLLLIRKIREHSQGLAGFRLFQDHDPRVRAACLADRRCAKVVLSRNPLDSYVSLKIAGATGPGRLGDRRHAHSARVASDPDAFAAYAAASRQYQEEVRRDLQTAGQTAYFLTYDDVADPEVMNGLARFLGVTETRAATSNDTKKQNPESLEEKVTNYPEMVAALGRLDPYDLGRYPVFEQKRGPIVPQYVAAATSPLLFLPVRGAPVAPVLRWLAALDDMPEAALQRDFTQKTLRNWMREAGRHRSFTVIRHPVPRLYEAFCHRLLLPGPERVEDIRAALMAIYEMPFPEDPEAPSYDLAAHRALFLQVAKFVAGNLSGQTSIRTDATWASQLAILQGVAGFTLPDRILREDQLARELPELAASLGRPAPGWAPETRPVRFALEEVYDAKVEAAVRQAYQRDYLMFGFGDWR
jgi:hypothetical protein